VPLACIPCTCALDQFLSDLPSISLPLHFSSALEAQLDLTDDEDGGGDEDGIMSDGKGIMIEEDDDVMYE
jgi:hypothetical protein